GCVANRGVDERPVGAAPGQHDASPVASMGRVRAATYDGRMTGNDAHGVIGQAGEDLQAATGRGVVSPEVDTRKLEDSAVADLHNVARLDRQCLGRWCRWGRLGR